eukprot:1140079-Pelagomonas_calceolata.AAC.1
MACFTHDDVACVIKSPPSCEATKGEATSKHVYKQCQASVHSRVLGLRCHCKIHKASMDRRVLGSEGGRKKEASVQSRVLEMTLQNMYDAFAPSLFVQPILTKKTPALSKKS